jgi:predicted dehydrogenase
MADKIGIAVIGCGRIGITHLEAIKDLSDSVELVAIVEMNTEILQRVTEKYRPKRSYSSITKALQDNEIDAVVLALPHNLHCPITLQAAEAKKHVLVEKPFAISVREAEEMIKATEDADVTLMVAQSQRFVPALQVSKTYLSRIGKPFNMLYLFMTLFNTSNAPIWWKSAANTGGLLFPMIGGHTLDYSLWLFDDRQPVSVFAKSYSNNSSFEGDDEGTIIIELDDGSFITNHLSMNTTPSVQNCFVKGPLGTMTFARRYNKGWPVGRAEMDLLINGETVFKDEGKEWNFVLQMKEFLNAIKGKRKPSASGEIGKKVVRAIEAAMESARTKQIVKF